MRHFTRLTCLNLCRDLLSLQRMKPRHEEINLPEVTQIVSLMETYLMDRSRDILMTVPGRIGILAQAAVINTMD